MSQDIPSPEELVTEGLVRTKAATTAISRAAAAMITCEYPPTLGGVSDYTFQVASELEQ